jgi:hypothetical protein
MTEHLPDEDNEALQRDQKAIGGDFDRVFKGIDRTLESALGAVDHAVGSAEEAPEKRRRVMGRAFLRGAARAFDLSGSGMRNPRYHTRRDK